MKTYIVKFSEPIKIAYSDGSIKTDTIIETFSLSFAKSLIKKNMDKYVGSSIIKTWGNGDWKNLGEIKIKGSNKTFTANTKQRALSY